MNRRQRRSARHHGEPSRTDFERIAEQVETNGCDRCGARFGDAVPYLIARTRAGWVGRCLNCNNDFLPGRPQFIGIGIFGVDPWSEDDRDWFRANPTRSWRLRKPMRGEVETMANDEHLAEQSNANTRISDHGRQALCWRDKGGAIAIAVYQFEPGKRVRVPIALLSDDPLESYTDAGITAFLPALVELIEKHRGAGVAETAAAKAAIEAQTRRRIDAVVAKLVKPKDAA